ncbi:MAG: hypothetical protein RLZ75_2761 [Pseudomonadota bacterium]|jgi:hypothetical protein
MDNKQAQDLINDVLQHKFNREKFSHLIRNLLNNIEPRDKHYSGTFIPEAYREHIHQYWRVGKYISPTNDELDILIVEVKSLSKLNTARTTLRNFAIKCLNTFEKDYSLIAFYAKDDNGEDWRFSFIKQEHTAYLNDLGKVKTKTDTLPARRYSFLVGEHENSYTARKQLLPLLTDSVKPTLAAIEQAFSIEKVTNEFFQQYKELYIKLSEHLATQALFISGTEEENRLKVARFAKKLLGQIVFLYFLQKKGWLGVEKNSAWGTGDKRFLSNRFSQISEQNANYYRDFLQFLFYEALAQQRGADSWYAQFNCKIPFLNGGLFEADYDWKNQSLNIPNDLFRNKDKNKAGDEGIGILDVFDRYNFTIKEDEPLEKEVAVDPEMLGKVFENMLDITERKSKGAFYTPREIVHYMCQESLIHYLQDAVPEIEKADIEAFIRKGLMVLENDKRVVNEGKETKDYSFKTPESIRLNAEQLDNQLAQLKICDPAIGSGAFPVGLLHEVVNARLLLQLFTPKKYTAYSLKLHCIQQCIYGVDLDASAVDISRLRLWLSLIVDYDKDDANEIKALPNLDYKIMQGNSLVENFNGIKLFNDDYINQGDDTETEINNLKQRQSKINAEFSALYKNNSLTDSEKAQKKIQIENETKNITKLLKTLQYPSTDNTTLQDGVFNFHNEEKQKVEQLYKLHDEFFACTPAKKQAIRQQISELEWELIEATLKERHDTAALEQIKVLREKNEKPFFLWKLNFPEVFKQQGGFDIVIGNPPYGVSIKGEYRTNIVNQLGKVPDYEIYYYFIEIARFFLKSGGVNSYIIPNTFLFNVFAEKYREKLIKDWSIRCVVDCTAFKIFDAATVLNAITFFIKEETENNKIGYKFTAGALNFAELSSRKTMFLEKEDVLDNNKNWGLLFKLGNSVLKIISKIKKSSLILKELFPEYSQGLIAYDKYQGQSEETIKNRIYHYDKKEKHDLKKFLWGEDVVKYDVNWNGREWIDYCDGIANPRQPKFFKGKRILIREITNPSIFAAYTDEELYHDPSIIVVLDNDCGDAKFLLAILNSRLASFYHFNSSPKATKGAFPKILVTDIKNFPIPKINPEQQQPFINLVDYILFGKEHKLKLQTAYFEQLIDGLVFELYFADEIAAANKPLFKHLGELKPITDTLTTEEKRAVIQSEFDRLYVPSHPVRNHLETLDSVEEVRIIKEALE